MVSFELNDPKKIGIGLTGFGVFFSFLGIIFFFDKGLLAMGNILFIAGLMLTIGLKSTMLFFAKPKNYKGTTSFGVGFFLFLIGWPFFGMILEAYGFIVLFSGFWPTVAVLLQRLPILGWIFQQPAVTSIASGNDSPRRLFASKFFRKRSSVNLNRPRQPDESEGQRSVLPVIPSPPPPRSQQQSLSEQGQGQSDPPVVVPPPLPDYFPPSSMSPHFSSLYKAYVAPFYPYYLPPSSQTTGSSTGPYPRYRHPYYYPYPVQPKHGEPSRRAEVGVEDHATTVDKRQYIEPEGDNFNPSRPPTHKIRDIIKNKYDAPYLSWKKIPKEIRDMWFREFQKEFRWLPEHSTRIRTNFERRGATRLRYMFTKIRKYGQRPIWIGEGVWADLSRAWATPEFTKIRKQNKQNKTSDCGGLGSSLHIGGSVPHTEHRRRLKKFRGREPTLLELHTRTHQHQADHHWIDEKAKKAHDDFVRARESRQSIGEGSSSGSTQISEYHTWPDVIGGKHRERVYSLSLQGYAYEGNSSTSTFYDPSGAEETVRQRVAALTREIEEMRKVQNEMQAELRSYRDENQRKKEQETVQPHTSPESEDTDKD